MSKSKEVLTIDYTPVYDNNTQIENVESTHIESVESYVYLGQRYSTTPQTKTKKTGFANESRPDEHHSPSTATSSREKLDHA